MTSYLISDLKAYESCRLTAYQDIMGIWTIGWGHTGREVHPGLVWTQDMADSTLSLDVFQTQCGLDSALPWFAPLEQSGGDQAMQRTDALTNMAFNLGVHGLLEFSDFLAYCKAGRWLDAANDLRLNTRWYSQVGNRGRKVALQIETGVHQTP